MKFAFRMLIALFVSTAFFSAVAQSGSTKSKPAPQASAAVPEKTEAVAAPDAKAKDPMENLTFRNLGPAAGGGRVSAVVGIPGQPNVYYVGAAAGGVFKTTDGGLSWKAIFE